MLENDKNKQNPFKVPENYFQNFNTDIMDKLPAKEKKATRVPLWAKIIPGTAAAAALIGVLFMTGILDKSDTGGFMANNHGVVISTTNVSNVDEEEYYLFLEEEVTKARYRELIYSSN